MDKVKRYTISDIAKEVGVSNTTVSRYLSGQFQYMSKETKEKIRTAIQKHNYRPSLLARGLKANRSYLLGVIMPQVHRVVSSHSIRGICMACTNTKYSPVFVSIEDDIDREPSLIQNLLDHRVDGILSFTGSGEQHYRRAADNGIPVVLVDRCSDASTLDSIFINHYTIVQESLLNLQVMGYTKIALFSAKSSFSFYSTVRSRRQAYFDFVTEKNALEYIMDESDLDDIKAKIQTFIDSYPNDRKAIFVSSMSALPMVNLSCMLIGIKYPDDLAVLGYALEEDHSTLSSGLTVISQPIYDMCSMAVDLLGKRIEETMADDAASSNPPSPVHIAIPATLKIRNSTLNM